MEEEKALPPPSHRITSGPEDEDDDIAGYVGMRRRHCRHPLLESQASHGRRRKGHKKHAAGKKAVYISLL